VEDIDSCGLSRNVLRDVDEFRGFGIFSQGAQVSDETRLTIGIAFVDSHPIGTAADEDEVNGQPVY
jgi:hypothetical protein